MALFNKTGSTYLLGPGGEATTKLIDENMARMRDVVKNTINKTVSDPRNFYNKEGGYEDNDDYDDDVYDNSTYDDNFSDEDEPLANDNIYDPDRRHRKSASKEEVEDTVSQGRYKNKKEVTPEEESAGVQELDKIEQEFSKKKKNNPDFIKTPEGQKYLADVRLRRKAVDYRIRAKYYQARRAKKTGSYLGLLDNTDFLKFAEDTDSDSSHKREKAELEDLVNELKRLREADPNATSSDYYKRILNKSRSLRMIILGADNAEKHMKEQEENKKESSYRKYADGTSGLQSELDSVVSQMQKLKEVPDGNKSEQYKQLLSRSRSLRMQILRARRAANAGGTSTKPKSTNKATLSTQETDTLEKSSEYFYNNVFSAVYGNKRLDSGNPNDVSAIKYLKDYNSKEAEYTAYKATMRKLAEDYHKQAKLVNTGNNLDFEKQFEQLSYDYVNQRSPAIMPYVVGFQIVDKNEENTKAVGVYGFKVGDIWLYVPIFYSNAMLKGHELLYIQTYDRFVPLKDNWVSAITNKKAFILGGKTEKTLGQLNATTPDMWQLTKQPYSYKYGAYATKSFVFDYPSKDVTTHEFLDHVKTAGCTIYDACHTNIHAMNKYLGLADMLDMRHILHNSKTAAASLMSVLESSPVLKTAFLRVHGQDYLLDALGDLRYKYAEPKIKYKGFDFTPMEVVKEVVVDNLHASTPTSVKFVIQTNNGEETWNFLSEDHKTNLVRKGYTVLDNREDKDVSVIIDKSSMNFHPPQTPGIYRILMGDGSVEEFLILFNTYPNNKCPGKTKVLAINIKTKEAVFVTAANLLCFNTIMTKEYRDWYKELGKGSLKVVSSYDRYSSDKKSIDAQIVLNENRESTAPFVLTDKLDSTTYDISWVDVPCVRDSYDYSDLSLSGFMMGYDIEQLSTYGTRSDKFTTGTNKLYLPKEYKILNVKVANHGNASFSFGDLSLVQSLLMNKFSSLKVVKDGPDYLVNNVNYFGKKAALKTIICDEGFREKQAESIISYVDKIGSVDISYIKPEGLIDITGNAPNAMKYHNWYKKAAPMVPQGSDGFLTRDINAGGMDFQMPPPQYTEPLSNGAVIQEPMFNKSVVEGLRAGDLNPQENTQSPLIPPDPMIVTKATEAANNGQTELFDTHMLSVILKNNSEEKLLQGIIPVLELAVDKIGRMLVHFYYHNSKYVERFGSVDTPDLENNLLNNFEALGDLCLFLLQKDIRPLQGLSFNSDVLER